MANKLVFLIYILRTLLEEVCSRVDLCMVWWWTNAGAVYEF